MCIYKDPPRRVFVWRACKNHDLHRYGAPLVASSYLKYNNASRCPMPRSSRFFQGSLKASYSTLYIYCFDTRRYNGERLFQMPADGCTHIYYTHFILELAPVRRHSAQSSRRCMEMRSMCVFRIGQFNQLSVFRVYFSHGDNR